MAVAATSDLRTELDSITADGVAYFREVEVRCGDAVREFEFDYTWRREPDRVWDVLDDELRDRGLRLTERALRFAGRLAEHAKAAPLTGDEDGRDVKEAAKMMRSALRLRRYVYSEPEVLHDEGVALGFRPAAQGDASPAAPEEAEHAFSDATDRLSDVLALIESGGQLESGALTSGHAIAPTRYRTGSAFIMMWMDSGHPELADVSDAVKSVFRTFGIRAVRADDIEHEGLITERVLSEIAARGISALTMNDSCSPAATEKRFG